MIVRSTDALNLGGFAQITLSWWNSAGDINFHGFIGLSTNADLDAADWHNTNISHVFVDAVEQLICRVQIKYFRFLPRIRKTVSISMYSAIIMNLHVRLAKHFM